MAAVEARTGSQSASAPASLMVDARGLHTHYGRSHILHGVDLQVHRGETVCLMGRNGMGKTTTIRSILGLTPITEGTVTVAGKDMTRAETHHIIASGIGYVPEGRGMFPSLSVRESLQMAARPGVDGRRDWTLERVLETFPRLGQRINHMAGNLSGGEQQMVAIGRALMLNPELLILDEATEGLAPLIRKEIWRVISMVKGTGIASLIVDKNVNALMEITDRSLIMVKGRVLHDGPSSELRKNRELLQQHIGV